MGKEFDFEEGHYLKLIVQINDRFARAIELLGEMNAAAIHKDVSTQDFKSEEFFLQIRLIIEGIFASSVVVHQGMFAEVFRSAKAWNDPSAMTKKLKRMNPGFMPRAVKAFMNTPNDLSYEYVAPALSAQDLIKLHGWSGNFLHLSSFDGVRSPRIQDAWSQVEAFCNWMNEYLSGHVISLYSKNSAFFFDGAGAIHGKPLLFSLNTERVGIQLQLVRVDSS